MLTSCLAIVLGFALLTYGADRFVIGAAAVAHDLGVSHLIIGLTVVAFATSAPEMLVSADAALNKASQMAIGNAIGSNIANIGLVVGLTAMIVPLKVASGILRREYPLMFVALLIALLLMIDGDLNQMDGVIMALALVAVIWVTVRLSKRTAQANFKANFKANSKADPYFDELANEIPTTLPLSKAILWFLAGLIIMLIGSRILVWGAINIAEGFGVSELVIGLTIVAVGTSLPELAASVTSALKGDADLAVGNVLGSNIFNMLGVLCLPGLIHPSGFSVAVLQRDFPVMLGLSLLLFVMSFGYKGTGIINRYFGLTLLLIFFGYQWMLYTDAGAG